MAFNKINRRLRIKKRIRKSVFGTSLRPRMSVFRSNKHIAVQIIDDQQHRTLLTVTSVCEEFEGSKIQQASLIGSISAKKALEKGITKVVFDRNGYLYHGRVKQLAEAARQAGLEF